MLTFNGVQFAQYSEKRAFKGFYKVNKKSISLFNGDKVKIGVVVNNVLGRATKLDNGKWWYSYGTPSIIGDYGYMDQCNDVDKAMELLG